MSIDWVLVFVRRRGNSKRVGVIMRCGAGTCLNDVRHPQHFMLYVYLYIRGFN